ncbi:MAG: two pore domain potassium channel family protein [Aestuariibacter sp.]|nr:two pore domain potassium channel family protein [Aestuariibacter sp.]|tara:strand:- start:108997 stop:110100 length:1104 start_codon:yes stop_codon:yes gene_type:complete
MNLLAILKRRRYKRRVGLKSIKDSLRNAVLQLSVMMSIHSMLIMLIEKKSVFESIWFTMVSVTTVGYGGFIPQTTAGKVTTMVLVFSVGIWLVAHTVSLIVEYATERTKQKRIGNWNWKMKEAIVLMGAPSRGAEVFLKNLLEQIRATELLAHKDVVIVSTNFPDGLPESVADLGAVLLNYNRDDKALYEKDVIKNATMFYFLASDEVNNVSNSVTFNALSLLVHSEAKPWQVIAETTKECDRERFLGMGATAIIRPIRAYPEMAVRAMVNEQNAAFIENMFSSKGDEPQVFPLRYVGTWSKLALRCIDNDLGSPVGYINADDKLITNPKGSDHIYAKGVQLLIKEGDKRALKILASWAYTDEDDGC